MLRGRRHREIFIGPFGFLFVCFCWIGSFTGARVRPKEEVIIHYLTGTSNDWAVNITLKTQVPGG